MAPRNAQPFFSGPATRQGRRAGVVADPPHSHDEPQAAALAVHDRKETFLPSTFDQITLIAGQGSALTFVRTEAHFWPLWRQVYLDFDTRREVVNGVPRIGKDGVAVAEEPLQYFAVLYPGGAINGDADRGAPVEAADEVDQQLPAAAANSGRPVRVRTRRSVKMGPH
ncbi:hypothetical protein GC209_17120 [bacterium]|nr:hypothetical protein [bacterium]